MFKVIPNNPEESLKPIPVAKFPKLMVHKGSPNHIRLFFSVKESLVISNPDKSCIGRFIPNSYYIDNFQDYNLPLTIQNILE